MPIFMLMLAIIGSGGGLLLSLHSVEGGAVFAIMVTGIMFIVAKTIR
ncbi:MAG: hypothetical protein AABY22_19505 [Nanoarchaeota archaeon]